jgi:hypothetical protein
MDFGEFRTADFLQAGGIAFLLTRSSRTMRLLGLVWLGGEVYSLATRGKATKAPPAPQKIAGDPIVLSLPELPALPLDLGAGLPQTSSSALAGLLGYSK